VTLTTAQSVRGSFFPPRYKSVADGDGPRLIRPCAGQSSGTANVAGLGQALDDAVRRVAFHPGPPLAVPSAYRLVYGTGHPEALHPSR